ncbi:MAG: hypothetical protein WA962_01005 [Ornithinimicrobium sp.]
MTRRSSWVARLLTVVVVAAAVGALLWFVGSLPRDPAVAAVVVVVLAASFGLLWWSTSDLPPPAEAASWYSVRRDDATVPPALDYRLVRLRRDLRDTLERSDREDLVHPLIASLTRERLLERHGIDLHTHPQDARQHLTPELLRYLAHPPKSTAKGSFRQISDALTGIEEL